MRLEALGCVPARYLMLEISADLRERQRRTILERVPQLARRVEWLDAPPETAFDGVVLANEVLDALPVTRFRWIRDRCEELGVTLEQDRLGWAPRPASASRCGLRVRSPLRPADGKTAMCRSTVRDCRRGRPRSRELIAPGLALWIDYGLPRWQYYLAERRTAR